MLIEFSVANFYSIKEWQTLSMVASKGTELEETHTFAAPISGGRSEIRLLRSAAIYGANAAGKTNLLFAMGVMCDMVMKSALEQAWGIPLPVVPFMLTPKSREKPSEFEMHFIVDEVRYQYGFVATHEHVLEEWLIAYPRGRAQNWFSRAWESKTQAYAWEFGASFTGEKKLWRKSTRNNALFLSTAVQLNSQQLQSIYAWFQESAPRTGTGGVSPVLQYDARLSESGRKKAILEFLKTADPGIDDLSIKEKKVKSDQLPEHLSRVIKQTNPKTTVSELEVKTTHLDAAGNPVVFDIYAESQGTLRVFRLSFVLLDMLAKGRLVLVDELHESLHVELVKFMVNLFHNNRTNPHNAQLIFTTHETSLLNQELLRRDQIWFCEKNEDNATALYPLTDFHPRKGRENLELGYLSGVYGAVPYIRES